MRLDSALPVEMASGVDAFYLSGRVPLPEGLVDDLRILRTHAEKAGAPSPINLGGEDLWVPSHGWGRYPVVLEHDNGRLGLTDSEHLPAVRVQPVAGFLHSLGPEQVAPWFEKQVAAAIGAPVDWAVSRLDLFADLVGWSLGAEDRSRFACRARVRRLNEDADEFTGVEFGRRSSPIYARVYDKTRESVDRGKTWWHEKWGSRWDGSQVWRVEVELHRPALREFGLSGPDETLSSIGGVWGHCTEDWLTYRQPSDDSNKARWPIADEWRVVQGASLRGQALGMDRVLAAERSFSLATALPATLGYLSKAGALLGARDYNETVDRLWDHVLNEQERTGVSFEHRLMQKRRQMRIGA